jgi:hypothetical protein
VRSSTDQRRRVDHRAASRPAPRRGDGMTGGSFASLLVDLALLALLIWRQVARRPVSDSYTVPLILVVIGGSGVTPPRRSGTTS